MARLINQRKHVALFEATNGLKVDLVASHIRCRVFAATLAKVLRFVLRNSLIRSASFVRSLDFACVTDTLQHSTYRKFSTSLAKVPWGHAIRTGPLSPLLNRDLRAELRFDVRRWVSLFANPPNITLRRRLATELAHPVRAFGGPHYGPL